MIIYNVSVERYNLKNEYIDSWNSISEFLLSINKNPNNCSHISAACKGKRNSANGYKWKYKK
jgi:hypothetical protein